MDALNNKDSSLSQEVTIRPYKQEDYSRCREIFTEGMQQLVNPVMDIVFPRYLKIASVFLILVLAVAFRWSLWIVGLYIILCVILTALLYINIYIQVMKFVSGCLNSDLLDISDSYKGDSCMFIAEFHGEVVGMVGMMHSDQHKPGAVELQRMSVSRSVRRRGIANSLCKELIAVAKRKDFNKIILSTTGAQSGAKALYKKCGFQIVTQFPYPQKVLEELSLDCFELEI
ncbi:probable N-acetyltransferase camello [Actinia tenebrosa]|uniref:Probable N-acetyltransferase camello n=1 Tax=Actinia tenebrosa TaxID=6105 RepID=A0A6P8JBR2_ACTTE|nr:probable N-acetyltransferase camello [Actinia tenebrosa]